MSGTKAEVAAGAAVLAAAIGFLVYAGQQTGVTSQASGSYELVASFRSVEGIRVGTDVRLAGVKVGTVTALRPARAASAASWASMASTSSALGPAGWAAAGGVPAAASGSASSLEQAARLRPRARAMAQLKAREEAGVDAVICALGSTIAQAGSREAFHRIDHDYPLAFARLAQAQGAQTYVLNSAAGADPRSSIFYSRVKGELERDLRALRRKDISMVFQSFALYPHFTVYENFAYPLKEEGVGREEIDKFGDATVGVTLTVKGKDGVVWPAVTS